MTEKVAIRFRDEYGFTSSCIVVTASNIDSIVESSILYAQDICEPSTPCNSAILDFWVWFMNNVGKDTNSYSPRDYFILPYEVTDNENFDVYTIDILTGKIVERIKSST